MSTQLKNSELLVEISTEQQQLLSGGYCHRPMYSRCYKPKTCCPQPMYPAQGCGGYGGYPMGDNYYNGYGGYGGGYGDYGPY